jgi:glycosyltransferase involved in cell wall biosynthesis
MSGQRTLLHIFSTFNVGGPQSRFVQLANHFGRRYRHRIVAMDGNVQIMNRLALDVEAELLNVPVEKGATLTNLRNFRRVLSEMRPDLLVTANWGAIEWAMANFDHRIPHLHMEDGFGPEEAERQLPRRVWTRRLALSRSTVMLPSLTLFRLARDVWKLPRARLLHIPNGVDCARFAIEGDWEFAASHGMRQDEPIIGAVGGLRAEKNLVRLLDAFALVLGARPAQLVLVGDGPLMGELKEAAEARGVADKVLFTGASLIPERFLALFSVYALSSDTEQMPLSVLEAMAASRAIAATDVGDLREMVAEENRRFIVPRDPRALSEAILSLIAAPERAQAIGCANRARAIAVYEQSDMFAAYQRLFDGELGPRAAPSRKRHL